MRRLAALLVIVVAGCAPAVERHHVVCTIVVDGPIDSCTPAP